MTTTIEARDLGRLVELAELHLERITLDTIKAIREKYRSGQREHGGRLWEKNGMLARITQEHLDAVVYGHTLREQLSIVSGLMKHARIAEDRCDVADAVEAADSALDAILRENPTG